MAGKASVDIASLESLDTSSAMPLYAQIADRFASAIRRSHATLVGSPLPSESECMEYFRVSRPTVRQAMERLLTEGLIVRNRGRGTFVAPQRLNHDLGRAFEDEMRAAQREVRFNLLERVTLTAPAKVRTALRLPPGAKVERIRRVRLLEGQVFGYEERFVAAALGGRISDAMLTEKAIVSIIRELAGEPPASFRLTIRSSRAGSEYGPLLGISRSAPVLSSEHTYVLANGEPVLFGIVVFHGENYEFSVEAAITPS